MQGPHTMCGQIHTELDSTVMQINAGTPLTMCGQIHTELDSTVMQINAGTPHDVRTDTHRAGQHRNADQRRDSSRWVDRHTQSWTARSCRSMQGLRTMCGQTHTELGSTVMQINAGTPYVGQTDSLSDSDSAAIAEQCMQQHPHDGVLKTEVLEDFDLVINVQSVVHARVGFPPQR
jgi:hypothetical protein